MLLSKTIMATLLPISQTQPKAETFYPSSDGKPLAETYVHLYAILITLEVLRQYLEGQQATVLSNQFLYYSEGFPKLRIAPDIMVIFNVTPGGRDNYKTWEERQVPAVIFEMTSEGTKDQDQVFKKTLYSQLGVQEYWLFDPKGEWIEEKLKGYRLHKPEEEDLEAIYEVISDRRSQPLQLRLEVDGQLIAFYREDTGEKLLIPSELATALKQEAQRRQEAEAQVEQARQRAEQAEAQVKQLKARLREMGVDPDAID
jgi:Uma2 family endonuclease